MVIVYMRTRINLPKYKQYISELLIQYVQTQPVNVMHI